MQPLRLESLHGSNYKAFEQRFDLDIAPLTILFGRNGSGKSALLRLPLALLAGLRGGSAAGLPLNVRGMRMGDDLRSFVHGAVVGRFELGVRLRGDVAYELNFRVGHDTRTTFRLPGQWIEQWSVRNENKALVEFEWQRAGKTYRSSLGPAPTSFGGLVPMLPDGMRHPAMAYLHPLPTIVHLGPARAVPLDEFEVEQPNVELDVGSDGASTRKVLGMLKSRTALAERVIEFVRRCFDVELRIEDVAQGPVQGTIVRARPARSKSELLPLVELGTGLGHALPLLVQYAIASDEPGTVVLCEEPEAHCHPAVHARIADAVLDAVLPGNCSTIIETHSETFVLRVRRRVAEGKLRPDQVAFYWIDDERDGVELRRLSIDERGRIADWPEGWFDSALHEVQAIRRAVEAP